MAAEQHNAPTLSGATVPHSLVVLVNDTADALDEMLDVQHLLMALSASGSMVEPRALNVVTDGHRVRLKQALEGMEKIRSALGLPIHRYASANL